MNKTAVIGAGSWGTALAILLAEKGEKTCLWGHRQEHMQLLQKERQNSKYLPGKSFPANLSLESDLTRAVSDADCVVMVVPSHGFRDVFKIILPNVKDGAFFVSATKGIELNTLMSMTEVMKDESPVAKKFFFGALSGPSFAEEVAAGEPTAVTIAFSDDDAATLVQELFSTDLFRAYTSTDVLGVEICGALKNVIAIGAGICEGLGYGLNARAALITRGLAEITRLGVSLGADQKTFAGLSGLGDLVLTCTGSLSRNRTVGLKLGSGKTLEQTLEEMTMVAEGVKTTKSCYNLARERGIEMPILEQVYQILYENKDCRLAVKDLFSRGLKCETC
ncbi:NAD(P)H-dependent glycerol-3-phosphate dehydrogenase [Desulfogranum japonicum]|uniref:NAD(P)H-dependent glycerol-3-phosphate dehydrogenase n=1 Tax=Desulfogranum japonicum TaxID=231447 RepID=UPI00054F3830